MIINDLSMRVTNLAKFDNMKCKLNIWMKIDKEDDCSVYL